MYFYVKFGFWRNSLEIVRNYEQENNQIIHNLNRKLTVITKLVTD